MSKICVRCSTVNLDNFTYCKYCGAALPTVEKRQSSVPFREHVHDEAPEYEGSKPTVSEEEYAAYVGKNTRFILPKFRTLKETGRRIYWCLPVLLLGLFAGFFGMSAYFFSRKMIKVGLILALCGILLTSAEVALNLETDKSLLQGYFGIIAEAVENPEAFEDVNAAEEKLNLLLEEYLASYNPWVSIVDRYFARSILPVMLGAFTTFLYYNSATRRIERLKAASPDGTASAAALKKAGGYSVGMIFIPVAAALVCSVMRAILLII